MISETEARELIVKFKDLQKQSLFDSSKKIELRRHEDLCLQKFKYIVMLKMYKYKKFANYDDLVQDGYEALVKAISNFKPEAGSFFWWARKYIDTKVSRSANLHTAVRYPLKFTQHTTPHKESFMPILKDKNNAPDKPFLEDELKKIIDSSIDILTDYQKQLISMHYGLDGDKPISIVKIAEQLSVTKTDVNREIKNALAAMRSHIRI